MPSDFIHYRRTSKRLKTIGPKKKYHAHFFFFFGGGRLGMSCRPKHPRFKSPTGVPLNYLIHSSSGWSRVFVVYSLRMGLKGLALVRFHVIKK